MIETILKSYLPVFSLTTIIGLVILSIVAPSVLRMVASTWDVVMNMFKPILTALGEGVVSFSKYFMEGLGVIFSNLSTLSVIAVVVASSGWYFRTWNDDHIRAPLVAQIEQLQKELKVCKGPAVTRKRSH